MFFPFRTDAPLHSLPWMNWLLIAFNVLSFLAQLHNPHLFDQYMLSPRTPQLSHFLTYAFLHSGWGHLLGNMLFLYLFGNNVNDKMGPLGYLAFYLSGAVFAGMGFVLTQQNNSPVLGASGAVAAVTGAYLILFPRSNVTIVYILGRFEITSLAMILFFFAKDLFYGLLGFAEGASSGVAHTAHLGGSLFGFLMSFTLLAVGLLPRDPYDFLSLLSRWNKRRQYQALVRQGYNPFAHESGKTPAGAPVFSPDDDADPKRGRIMEIRGQISQAITDQNLPGAAALYLRLKAIDPDQVLSKQSQLDIANQLAHQQQYPAAVEAYEGYLRLYPGTDSSAGHVSLMLGLILARYLNRPTDAIPHLQQAMSHLHSGRDYDLAKAELAHLLPPN